MDERPDRFEDPELPDRLRSWFDHEVQQANVDLHRSTLRAVHSRSIRSRTVGGSLTLLAVIAILITAGTSRLPFISPGGEPSHQPSVGVSDTAPPTIVPTNPLPGPTAVTAVVGTRYADGIPSILDGAPVLRPSAVGTSAPGDDSSFLLGGWAFDFGAITIACPAMVGAPAPYGPRCGTPFLAEAPTYGDSQHVQVDRWTSAIPPGPVVLRVHRHDQRSETCAPEARDRCESMAVIEAAVWTGDDVTAAAPISAVQAVNRLASADPSFGSADLSTLGAQLTDLRYNCITPFPTLAWLVAGSGIETLLVFPSVAGREAVDQDFTASGWVGRTRDGAIRCSFTTDAVFSNTWVSGENVMVAIQTDSRGPTSPQAALIEAVRAALHAP